MKFMEEDDLTENINVSFFKESSSKPKNTTLQKQKVGKKSNYQTIEKIKTELQKLRELQKANHSLLATSNTLKKHTENCTVSEKSTDCDEGRHSMVVSCILNENMSSATKLNAFLKALVKALEGNNNPALPVPWSNRDLLSGESCCISQESLVVSVRLVLLCLSG